MSEIQIPEIGFLEHLPEEIYHNLPHVSSHGIKEALRSPAHYHHRYINKVRDFKKSKAKEFGKAVHAAFLEPKRFLEMNIVQPIFTGKTKDGEESERSKEALEKKKEWLANVPEGAIITTQENLDRIVGMSEVLRRHKVAAPMLEQIAGEISGFWIDSKTKLKCRMRIDGLITGKKQIVDYKTTIDASPQSFAKDCANYGYDVQGGTYHIGIQHILNQNYDFAMIAQESEAPYSVAVYVPDENFIHAGVQFYHAGLQRLKIAYEENYWPSYSETALNLSLPSWRMWQVESL